MKPNEEYPYLDNTKADHRLVGGTALMNPFMDHVSSQRGQMLSNHIPQSQVLKGAELPRVFSGYEHQVGKYEFSTCRRDQDVYILDVIPKFVIQTGASPLIYNPSFIIFYLGEKDKKIGYFEIKKFTMVSDDFGYTNKLMNTGMLESNRWLPKEVQLATSPAHKGNRYCMGTNLNCAYMSLPHVTEDAFIISESAAKKMTTEGFKTVHIDIGKNQIPLGLYNDEEGFKCFPDIGTEVHEDGIICALRTPTPASIITDMQPENLSKVFPLHDSVFYAPKGAKVVDVQVYINRKCRIDKSMEPMFSQIEKYREQLTDFYRKIWVKYLEIRKGNGNPMFTPEFNSLIARAVEELAVDNAKIKDFNYKQIVTPVKKKEPIEFIHLAITYQYDRPPKLGFKIAGRYGNKGVISQIVPDEDMPVDDFGIRADIVGDPISVFNRMNPGQWYEQYITRLTFLHITKPLREAFWNNDGKLTADMINTFYSKMISILSDINNNYANLIEETHPTAESKRDLMMEVIRDGVYIQVSPFQVNIDDKFIIKMEEKWGIHKTPVHWNHTRSDGKKYRQTSKRPVMIGEEYWHLLYKMPHIRTSGLSYVSQHRTPVKPSAIAKAMFPYSQTPNRLGEDEMRNVIMTAGPETAARILGEYANNKDAVEQLASHLINDPYPSKLKRIEMSTSDIIKGNAIINMTKHMFSTVGIDMVDDSEENK